MKAKLNFQEKPLSWLSPAEYNPRADLKPGDPDYEAIKESIKHHTYVDPIIANSDGTIISGHQRLKVLLDLGYDAADIVIVDKTKEEEKLLNLALNKVQGRWDEEKLYELLINLDLSNIDIQLSGFTLEELEDLKIKFEIEEAQEDEDFDEESAIDAAEKDTKSKRGCIWLLGNHRLMCGDATSAVDMNKLLKGEKIDLVITDPPYNVAYGDKVDDLGVQSSVRKQSHIQNDDMDDSDFADFLKKFYIQTAGAMRVGASIYVFHADSNGLVFRQMYEASGLKLAQCLIWEKNTFVPGRQDYQWKHEPILYGWKEGAAHYFIDDRTQSTILLEDKPLRSDLHPTMKPIPLIGRLMKNSSKPGWKIFDPFGGSGTTIIAAEQLGRIAYSMELDEVFCDVIVQRWESYTGKTAVLEE